ncbi:DNA-processing protein DprA [Nitrospira sp. Kam-Ns4a]
MSRPISLRPWFALRAVRGLSDAAICRLVQAFGSPESVLAASTERLIEVGGLNRPAAEAVRREPDEGVRGAIERELRELDRGGWSVLTWLDEAYPARLRTIPDPPPLLYVSGRLTPEDRHAVAIVGSRRPSAAGRLLTEELSRDLAALGFTIVSGLARGIDGAAHRGALAGGGRTVAVLGCGIDRTYPPEHRALRERIEASGAVVTEFSVGAPPHAYHFPRRNRIISGLSLGVVVTEAAAGSGSLVTARLAADQGREVFAVPGFPRMEQSRGTNGLIKQGAKLVETVEDILEELVPQLDPAFAERVARRPRPAIPGGAELSDDERAVHALLSCEPVPLDELIARAGLSAAAVMSAVLALELKGMARRLPGPSCVRV